MPGKLASLMKDFIRQTYSGRCLCFQNNVISTRFPRVLDRGFRGIREKYGTITHAHTARNIHSLARHPDPEINKNHSSPNTASLLLEKFDVAAFAVRNASILRETERLAAMMFLRSKLSPLLRRQKWHRGSGLTSPMAGRHSHRQG